MKIGLLLLFFVFALTIMNAQSYVPFPDTNVFWNEIKNYQGECDPPDYCKYTYYFQRDTIINSYSYHKIYSNDSSSTSYVGGLRESDRKIYFFDNNCQNSILLYDFNFNVGDSILMPFLLCDTTPVYYMNVISIDSVLIGDVSYRKRINFNYGPPMSWIEGIGSLSGLLYPYYSGIACICFTHLVCFEQNDTILYLNEEFVPCFDYFVSNNDWGNKFDLLKVFPNPVRNHFSINFESGKEIITGIEFYNILGINIKTIQNVFEKKIQLEKDDFKAGIYIFKVLLSDDRYVFGKLIIE